MQKNIKFQIWKFERMLKKNLNKYFIGFAHTCPKTFSFTQPLLKVQNYWTYKIFKIIIYINTKFNLSFHFQKYFLHNHFTNVSYFIIDKIIIEIWNFDMYQKVGVSVSVMCFEP
jgi:hypothetical protein